MLRTLSMPPVRRLLTFLGALAVLLAVARTGAARPAVLVAFALYVVATTLWLRGQYVDDLDGEQWVMPGAGVLGLFVAGGAGLLLFKLTDADSLGLYSLIAVYLAVGALVMRWRRRQTPWPETRGVWLLAAGTVLAVLGLATLGRAHGGVSAALLLPALLLMLPIGLALSSEAAVRRLSGTGDHAARLRLLLGGGGLALFLVGAVIAVVLAGSGWLFVALAVAGLGVAALASNTQADIAAIVAVLALMGVTPAGEVLPERLQPADGERVLVALGDSYMSGEGAQLYYEGTDDGGGNQCRRSPTAWAAVAGQGDDFSRLLFLACSGARTNNVREEATPKPSASPQPGEGLTQLARYRALAEEHDIEPSLVVLSIGGNDAGFSAIGMMCLAPGHCSSQEQLWTRTLDQVRVQLDATYAEVSEVFPTTPVAVTAYPDPLADVEGCGELALSLNERRFVERFVKKLNGVVSEVAGEHGFHYLDGMQDALAASHVQLCDPSNSGRPGLNFIGLRSVSGIAEQRFNPKNWGHGSLHPNERGHAALLRAFDRWWESHEGDVPVRAAVDVDGAAGGPVTGGGPVEGGAGVPTPPCDLFATDKEKGCRAEASRWAQGQVADLLLDLRAVLGLLVLAGAWLASVSLFAWRQAAWSSGPSGPPS